MKPLLKKPYNYLVENSVEIYPLVTFRILFGIMMLISTIRFWANGWIETQLINPTFHFKFYNFYWVEEPSSVVLYCVFITLIISCIAISAGFLYPLFMAIFFLLFTYIELIDATNYLNHYYFISLVSFVMIFLPANRFFSIDNLLFKNKTLHVKAWQINIIKLMLGIVYFYAGIAKLNYDWLVLAEPLRTWLPSKSHLPIIGPFLNYEISAYLFSWAGAIFDLSIFFLLVSKKWRHIGYLAVVVFHLMTGYLFQIGMFPYIMIVSTLIFFSADLHKKLYLPFILNTKTSYHNKPTSVLTKTALLLFIVFNLIFPFRYILYPNHLFWGEEGYRFSWRVMLVEKAGYASFYVKTQDGKTEQVDNSLYLTPYQEKMMSTQADFILQYAHYIRDIYEDRGVKNPAVYADVFVTLNGRGSKRFVNPNSNLAEIEDSFKPKTFILPFND